LQKIFTNLSLLASDAYFGRSLIPAKCTWWTVWCHLHRGGVSNRTISDMGVSVEVHVTAVAPGQRSEIAAIVEHVLADRSGDWRVSIIGARANDLWEMKITGPNAFERSYT
jgi:hypothetical protein